MFCLQGESAVSAEFPHSASLYRYMEKRDFTSAYKIACLGITDNDWKSLGMQALLGLNFEVARKAFVRIRDVKYITLLNKFEQLTRQKYVSTCKI